MTLIFLLNKCLGSLRKLSMVRNVFNQEDVMISNDLSTIYHIINKTRLRVFAGIKNYHLTNVHELAQLLHRDYTNV